MARVPGRLCPVPSLLVRRRHGSAPAKPQLLPVQLRRRDAVDRVPQPAVAPCVDDRLLDCPRRMVLPLLLSRRTPRHSQPNLGRSNGAVRFGPCHCGCASFNSRRGERVGVVDRGCGAYWVACGFSGYRGLVS
ncbi:hypothetical protein SESBI_22893 [Sesbania bispinosa]|nr:hypothetical protein SESBI_22893 [Sesbania bispinosa]